MRSGLIAGGAVFVAAIGLWIGWRVLHRPKPAPVKLAPAVVLAPEITLTGRLESQSTEQVDASVAGVLDTWFVDVGQEVYENQLVGRIRNAGIDTAVQNAQAAVERLELRIAGFEAQAMDMRLEVSRTTADQLRARNELDRIDKIYQRYKNLMDAGALARLTFEKTEADYKSAKAEAANRDTAAKDAQEKAAALDRDSEEAKRTRVERTAAFQKAKESSAACDLHSPADGVVLTRNVHLGERVEESQEGLMTIATELTKLAASLTPDAAALARIRKGQPAFVRLMDAEVPGAVREVKATEVIVEFSSATAITKLGTAVQVRIVF